MKNNIGKTIKTVSIIILILGFVGVGIYCFSMMQQASAEDSFVTAIVAVPSIFIGSLLLYGFGDLVDIVNRIYMKLEETSEDN